MAEPEDLGRDIAENIGLMPLVTRAGEAGSGFLNMLQSLLPGGAAPQATRGGEEQGRTSPSPPKEGGFLSWLGSLYQPTVDAFQQDVRAVSEGRAPMSAMKDLATGLQFAGGSKFGPGMPRVPATRSVQRVFDPAKGWIDVAGTEEILPSVDPLRSIFMGGGSPLADLYQKILALNRSNMGRRVLTP